MCLAQGDSAVCAAQTRNPSILSQELYHYPFFKHKMPHLITSKKKNPLFKQGGIEESVPQDHHLSSLCKLPDAKRSSSGQIFLYYPHTHDRFL